VLSGPTESAVLAGGPGGDLLPSTLVALSSGWRKQELEMKELEFPKFAYYLDESDPDIVILRRQDGSFVAAFSASGATREDIVEAAREDYWELIQAHTNALSRKSQERLSS
jgi:hypothetical protein